MSPIRRSSRVRSQPSTIYDDAKKAKEEKLKLAEEEEVNESEQSDAEEQDASADEDGASDDQESEKDEDMEEDNGNNDEEEKESETDESESEDNDDDDADEDYETTTKRSSPKKSKSSTPQAKQTKRKNNQTKIQVQLKPNKRRRGATTPPRGTRTRARPNKAPRESQIRTALTNLAKKVLPTAEIEDPTASLVASLLFLNRTQPAKLDDASCSHFFTFPPSSSTGRTTRLHSIAKEVIAMYNDDPNGAQVKLLNLLFRSVGGTQDTDLDGEEDKLEELGNEEWVEKVTDLVDEMRLTPNDCVLFCTDPDGAVHYNAVRNAMEKDADMRDGDNIDGKAAFSLRDIGVVPGSLGVREYRKIYEEFWYVLGHVALVEGGMGSAAVVPFMDDELVDSSDSDNDDEDQDEGSDKKKKKRSSRGKSKGASKSKDKAIVSDQRFDTEVIREIVSRIVELVSVGQPDIRAAATTAVLSLAHAILDKTVYINDKLQIATRQFAAAIGGKNKSENKTSAKAESLRFQIDSLKRTRAYLEETIESLVIKGVFMQRYRDANMFIRASSIQALGTFVVRRPDLFLKDKYLKYFGWMLSDKAECVRVEALRALNLPFKVHQNAEKSGRDSGIPLSLLEHVAVKFIGRIADIVIDIQTSVQECGVTLMLSLLRAGFLDDVEDEKLWDQVNILAFESKSSPAVRRDALYFIMEQLEEFDDGEEDDGKGKKRKSNGSPKKSDRRAAQRLDAIASWAAHTLTDGDVPLDKIQIDLVKHLVDSLRSMPEHKEIARNWSAMIRALTDDKVAITSQGHTAGDRADVAKQRVLVQMLSYAAIAEVESVTNLDFLCIDMDPVEANALRKRQAMNANDKSSRKIMDPKGYHHEALSVALIKKLPTLLEKFKSDSKILVSLTSLPRFFVPSVFSLPQRKKEFIDLFNGLSEIYLLSTDEQVLTNITRSIKFLSEGDHARSNEAKAGLNKLVSTISDRIKKHINQKADDSDDTASLKSPRRRKSPRTSLDSVINSGDEDEHESEKINMETAFYLNLLRARILAMSNVFTGFLDSHVESTDTLCALISKELSRRLDSHKISSSSDLADDWTQICWTTSEETLPRLIAGIVDEGLQLILMVTTEKLCDMIDDENLVADDDDAMISQDEEGEKDGDKIVHHPVLTLRNCLIALVEKCYEQFLPSAENSDMYSSTQKIWADLVQNSGSHIACDLRTMFPKEWSNSTSPLLRALAIVDDSCLIGGYVRHLKSNFDRVDGKQDEGIQFIDSSLLPPSRAIAANWKLGNRLEAGMLLSHIVGSGTMSTEIISTLSRILKQVQPVRFLEAQMASLRQSYENWMNNDPEEIDAVEPTEEEMAKFEEEEAKHEKRFEHIVQCATKFSSSLGVSKLSDVENLSPALVGFLKEGIRFSFSNSDEFQLGSRLSFLSILIRYAHWIKREPDQKSSLASFLEDKEIELKTQQETNEAVHEDDLRALAEFRSALGLEDSKVFCSDTSSSGEISSQYTSLTPHTEITPRSIIESSQMDDESRDTVNNLTIAGTSAARMSSRASSMGSVRSTISSARSSLSPLYEEGGDEDDTSGNSSANIHSKTQSTFDEDQSDLFSSQM